MFCDSGCRTPEAHALRQSVYLCGEYDLSSDDDSLKCPPATLPRNRKKAGDEITRRLRALRGALGIDSSPKYKRRFRRSVFPNPIYIQSPVWHLSQADIQVNGLLGKPGKKIEVPDIPAGLPPHEHLTCLQQEGYKLVEQNR
jgi:hypothetical protein